MFKKVITLFFVFIICFTSAVTSFAGTEEDFDPPCGGVIEVVRVKILYAPIKSLIIYDKAKPDISGIVLKITYPSGEEEFVTIEKEDNFYCAGEFSVSIHSLNNAESVEYGIINRTLHLSFDKKFGGYIGDVNLSYLNIPSVFAVYSSISNYLKTIV